MRSSIPIDTTELDSQREFQVNSDFHSALIRACRNKLITIAMQPLFTALQVNLQRSGLDRGFHLELHRHHRDIADAIDDSDADAAGALMESHLRFLVPFYESAWTDLRNDE
jgi:DNA-binding GntR family transcriptional regulator